MGPRFFEVMISGRAMLLCDHNEEAYTPLGIEDGVHAVMFNSSRQFEALVHHYRAPENEPARLAIVKAARELVLSRHLWSHRAAYFEQITREALAEHRGREEKAAPPVRHYATAPGQGTSRTAARFEGHGGRAG